MNKILDDQIDGSEYVKFMADSTPYVESNFGLIFKKDNKREIKTIAGYIKRINMDVKIKQTAWNSFKVFTIDNKTIFECELADDKYISDRFEEDAIETHKRLYKVKNISELIQFLMMSCENLDSVETENENFSIKDWMVEQSLVPHEILYRRINQVVAYCKYEHISNIIPYENLTNYILDYLQMLIRRLLRHPDMKFNYFTDLRIFRYLKQEEFLEFKVTLNKVLGMLNRKELVTYYWIKKLQAEYDKFEDCIINYINRRIN